MKHSTVLLVLVLMIVGLSTVAFGWGNGTHTYIAKQVTHKGLGFDLRVAYAATLPDMFNLDFDHQELAWVMHNTIPTLGGQPSSDALATLRGIIIHGQIYGADYTAHIRANPQTHSPKADTGYFVLKGQQLAFSGLGALVANILAEAKPNPIDNQELAFGIAIELGHDLSETAVDLLVKDKLDKSLGLEIMTVADSRPGIVPEVLDEAYGQTSGFFASYESAWRDQMKGYGWVMTNPTPDAIQIFAGLQAPVAEMYIGAILAQFGYPGTTVSVSEDLVANGINAALAVVKKDYESEINKTIAFIKSNHVIPAGPAFALGNTGELTQSVQTSNVPERFALEGNYPNPFNPTTTVRYSLPATSHVLITIYNTLGQKVTDLVNGDLEAGPHSVPFDAAGLSSGIYFCRMQARSLDPAAKEGASFIDTKKLILAK